MKPASGGRMFGAGGWTGEMNQNQFGTRNLDLHSGWISCSYLSNCTLSECMTGITWLVCSRVVSKNIYKCHHCSFFFQWAPDAQILSCQLKEIQTFRQHNNINCLCLCVASGSIIKRLKDKNENISSGAVVWKGDCCHTKLPMNKSNKMIRYCRFLTLNFIHVSEPVWRGNTTLQKWRRQWHSDNDDNMTLVKWPCSASNSWFTRVRVAPFYSEDGRRQTPTGLSWQRGDEPATWKCASESSGADTTAQQSLRHWHRSRFIALRGANYQSIHQLVFGWPLRSIIDSWKSSSFLCQNLNFPMKNVKRRQ